MKRSNAQYSADIELIISLEKTYISNIISLLENLGAIIISLNMNYVEKHAACIHLSFSTSSINKFQDIILKPLNSQKVSK